MEALERMIDALVKEISSNIKAMSKIKSISEKKTQAEIIKLLCESLGVFFTAMATARADYAYDDDDEFYDEDYYDDDDDGLDPDPMLGRPSKKRKHKKDDPDDIPF